MGLPEVGIQLLGIRKELPQSHGLRRTRLTLKHGFNRNDLTGYFD